MLKGVLVHKKSVKNINNLNIILELTEAPRTKRRAFQNQTHRVIFSSLIVTCAKFHQEVHKICYMGWGKGNEDGSSKSRVESHLPLPHVLNLGINV